LRRRRLNSILGQLRGPLLAVQRKAGPLRPGASMFRDGSQPAIEKQSFSRASQVHLKNKSQFSQSLAMSHRACWPKVMLTVLLRGAFSNPSLLTRFT
jgi:hypothetical protein